MIVVDTNIVAYAYLKGDRTSLTQKLRELDSQWRLPTLWRHEFLNLLSMYVQHGGCQATKAVEIWDKVFVNLSPCESVVDMAMALKIACESKISAYDAQFITLAQNLGVPCVTEDNVLLKKFPGVAVSMTDFCSHKGA